MLAPFEPGRPLLTGNPGKPGEPSPATGTIVQGLRRAADVAGEHGTCSGSSRCIAVYGSWSIVTSIPQAADLMDEIDHPNVRLLYDVYHLWDAGRARAPGRWHRGWLRACTL
jgi:sugar phosphate isomerase/epimerase